MSNTSNDKKDGLALYRQLFEEFTNDDAKYAKTYLENPTEFARLGKKESLVYQVFKQIVSIHGDFYAFRILGGIALLASHALRPTNAERLAFISSSTNGSFVIYKTCCPDPRNTMFLKIAKSNSDFMEVEAVALKIFKTFVQQQQQKYFLTYCGSGQVLCRMSSSGKMAYLDIDGYKNGLIVTRSDNLRYKNYPFLITHAVPSGISLSDIMQAWRNIRYGKQAKTQTGREKIRKSMSLFHTDGLYDQALADPTNVRILSKARAFILGKFEDFIANVIEVARNMKFSHADLHDSNVLYDVLQGNFVMIDFGRACFDLKGMNVQHAFVWNEYLKLKTVAIDANWGNKIQENPNAIYAFYQNVGSRHNLLKRDSMLAKYNILIDFSGLAFVMYRDMLMSGFEMIHEPHPMFHIIRGTTKSQNMDTLHIKMLGFIQNYLTQNETLSLFDLMIVFITVVIHATLKTTDPVFDKVKQRVSYAHHTVIVPIDDIFSQNEDTIIYYWGQPVYRLYMKLIPTIEKLLDKLGYWPVLERSVAKRLKEDVGQIGGKKTMSRQDLDFIADLTKDNYEQRAKQLGGTRSKVGKSLKHE